MPTIFMGLPLGSEKKSFGKGLTNLEFFVSDAASVSREGYDLACIFDAWHDMGDPVGVAKAIKESLTMMELLWLLNQWR